MIGRIRRHSTNTLQKKIPTYITDAKVYICEPILNKFFRNFCLRKTFSGFFCIQLKNAYPQIRGYLTINIFSKESLENMVKNQKEIFLPCKRDSCHDIKLSEEVKKNSGDVR